MKRLVCKHCGSEDVDLSGFVHWDKDKQAFQFSNIDVLELDNMENQYADCADCGEHNNGVAEWVDM